MRALYLLLSALNLLACGTPHVLGASVRSEELGSRPAGAKPRAGEAPGLLPVVGVTGRITYVRDIRFAGTREVLLCGDGLAISRNGGQTWNIQELSAQGTAVDCSRASFDMYNGIVFAGGHHIAGSPIEIPTVVVSVDGGISWAGFHSPGGEIPVVIGGRAAVVDGFGTVFRPPWQQLPFPLSSEHPGDGGFGHKGARARREHARGG